ncbi:hypothetical protein [Microbacterium hominis]|uniref:Uncharacterized protein n=1 Tax=Microbacterium hominis TaxID=162426 RepID=A0A7D4UGX0_9MICO|nr:hypothetical protein [Microbacterium hominis]QKJ20249.1 hypothetical protein HQM25_13365 [Microbacterium hominis]
MKTSHKVALVAVPTLVVATLVALTLPLFMPLLPAQIQVIAGGTIRTVPGTVEDLFERTGTDGFGMQNPTPVSHDEVDGEYVMAASIWPWMLPPGWGFPRERGVADTPGHHWNGMGVKAAFAVWAKTALDTVARDDVPPALAEKLLSDVEYAYHVLFDAGLLSDRTFIEKSVEPLKDRARV